MTLETDSIRLQAANSGILSASQIREQTVKNAISNQKMSKNYSVCLETQKKLLFRFL